MLLISLEKHYNLKAFSPIFKAEKVIQWNSKT